MPSEGVALGGSGTASKALCRAGEKTGALSLTGTVGWPGPTV